MKNLLAVGEKRDAGKAGKQNWSRYPHRAQSAVSVTLPVPVRKTPTNSNWLLKRLLQFAN